MAPTPRDKSLVPLVSTDRQPNMISSPETNRLVVRFKKHLSWMRKNFRPAHFATPHSPNGKSRADRVGSELRVNALGGYNDSAITCPDPASRGGRGTRLKAYLLRVTRWD